ncbi:MAG: hypothetical protein K9H16_16015 [Bacteroidales bacterium]|nr:hypothetical protein [Bacteroidales bacterium]
MRKINFIQFILLVLFLTQSGLLVLAQDEGGNFDLGADVVSRYVWRGTDFGNSPAIQPWLSYSNSGFTVGAWGSYSTNGNSMQEADLFISYDLKEVITLTVTDYFFPNGISAGNNYFEYGDDSTGHVLEGMIAFNGVEAFPISVMAAYNFYGADKDNSLYFELAYGNTFKEIDYNVFVGGGTGSYYLYGEKEDDFGIVNLGVKLSKEIQITDKFSLPVSGSLITNPTAESIFIVFGFSL